MDEIKDSLSCHGLVDVTRPALAELLTESPDATLTEVVRRMVERELGPSGLPKVSPFSSAF
ncbi:hypothetical protein ACFQFC_36100 [Amorphoplanes digitatis]|uniref:FXSXX-COOH protein n=1 Tax=Actinoplanes digitatis TaxID=1868 RepID=A0A7W7HVQ8_9ACTN|nr:hypothetical protein [Actinoplanes digitatis]MBB4761583.1 FXSXX-COOH protein [Actinoplanes digitatis]BFE70130.1 hypothetical protein GCM10020092_034310 [Actinoplanes digitatis]GID90692.1 hypothetical protein Adi01nite_01040 [Actinoplanes digitatis]